MSVARYFLRYDISMDPYAVLGVSHGASQDETKKAFRTLAHKHHPDKGGDAEVFKKITAAYAQLQTRPRIVDEAHVARRQEVVIRVHFSDGYSNFNFESSSTWDGSW